MIHYFAAFEIETFSVFFKRSAEDGNSDIPTRSYLRCHQFYGTDFNAFSPYFSRLTAFVVDGEKFSYQVLVDYIQNFEDACWPCITSLTGDKLYLGFVLASKNDLLLFKLLCPHELVVKELTDDISI